MKISLLHPSRSRVDKSFDTLSKWLSRSKEFNIEIIVSLDEDDPQIDTYKKAHYPLDIIINPNRSAVDAINAAAKVATGDIMIVLSDDTDCPDNWAELIEMEVRGKKDFVLRVDDGFYAGFKRCQEWIITAPIFDRTYYNRFGYVYHPSYLHQFCDTEFSNIAYCLKKVVRSNLLFRHFHPSIVGEKRDEVMLRSDATWNQGEAVYLRRFKENFGLDIDPYDIGPHGESHRRWLQAKLKRR